MSRPHLVRSASLDEATAAEVLDLAKSAEKTDGVSPLDDDVRLSLHHPSPGRLHLLARGASAVAGYAHIDLSQPSRAGAHLVVAPEARRSGVGTALLEALRESAGARSLHVWAHGDLVAARDFAAARSLRRARELWQMAGSLDPEPAEPSYPEGVTVRTFEPGRDEEAWVAANAAAFADHPEQGRMTRADLEARMAEPWFDRAGFFLAEHGGELIGYHWTKVHDSRPGHTEPVGEVYVLGIVPEAQGGGLGKALTATGLRYLRQRGLGSVVLYVEGDNDPAIAVYRKLGLHRIAVDVMYEDVARTPPPGP